MPKIKWFIIGILIRTLKHKLTKRHNEILAYTYLYRTTLATGEMRSETILLQRRSTRK